MHKILSSKNIINFNRTLKFDKSFFFSTKFNFFTQKRIHNSLTIFSKCFFSTTLSNLENEKTKENEKIENKQLTPIWGTFVSFNESTIKKTVLDLTLRAKTFLNGRTCDLCIIFYSTFDASWGKTIDFFTASLKPKTIIGCKTHLAFGKSTDTNQINVISSRDEGIVLTVASLPDFTIIPVHTNNSKSPPFSFDMYQQIVSPKYSNSNVSILTIGIEDFFMNSYVKLLDQHFPFANKFGGIAANSNLYSQLLNDRIFEWAGEDDDEDEVKSENDNQITELEKYNIELLGDKLAARLNPLTPTEQSNAIEKLDFSSILYLNDRIYDSGAISVAIISPNYNTFSYPHLLAYKPITKPMRVTKCSQEIITSIENTDIDDILKLLTEIEDKEIANKKQNKSNNEKNGENNNENNDENNNDLLITNESFNNNNNNNHIISFNSNENLVKY
eukprot:TRINITY_DN2808_c0_g1_i1.p1 TRINITY_DN2808_c0_g1~~TRINITY_DN2808_c0_g1_i1.p1  ORF type:complete len:445 (+),score=176.71 TRINITY_DN2808_c0_g1_i1:62-1396(+)